MITVFKNVTNLRSQEIVDGLLQLLNTFNQFDLLKSLPLLLSTKFRLTRIVLDLFSLLYQFLLNAHHSQQENQKFVVSHIKSICSE